MNLYYLQREVGAWSQRNFGDQPAWCPLLGVVEEVGELSHSYLKRSQGIRGTDAEHLLAMEDAVGDIVIYLADFCNRMGFDMAELVATAWREVKERDWKASPADGRGKTVGGPSQG